MNLESLLKRMEDIELSETDAEKFTSLDGVLGEMLVLQEKSAKAGFRSSQASELASTKIRELAEQFQEQVGRREEDLAEARKHVGELLDEQKRLMRALIEIADLMDFGAKPTEHAVGDGDTSVPLLLRELRKVLNRCGLEPTAHVGESFDPELHEAVDRQSGTNVDVNSVTEVVKQGYRFHGAVLRTAKVVVAG